ncbi:MAG: hypothetical protein JKX70_09405, partial [Phycisphaerales bacterium]|nr:hypothetical protein [Phycisphaerales bacterium]
MRIGSFANFNFGLRQLEQNQAQIAQSYERLATGKKINRASDDPSGMIAATQHKVRIYSIEAEIKGLNRNASFLGAKEGGLSVISEQLEELNGLVVQAANLAGNSQEEQDAIKLEIESVLESIDRIATTTTFKGQTILSEYRVGSIAEGLNSLATLAFEDPEAAQKIAKNSVDSVATKRAIIGNSLNEIDSKQSVLSDELINLTDSLSSIEDTDFAAESAKLIRAQILEQASILAIDINRQSAQQVLSLLQSAADTAK